MQNLQDLGTVELIDMLSFLTAQLTTKITTKDHRWIQQYEYDIVMIQSELNSRNKRISNPGVITQNIGLTSGRTN